MLRKSNFKTILKGWLYYYMGFFFLLITMPWKKGVLPVNKQCLLHTDFSICIIHWFSCGASNLATELGHQKGKCRKHHKVKVCSLSLLLTFIGQRHLSFYSGFPAIHPFHAVLCNRADVPPLCCRAFSKMTKKYMWGPPHAWYGSFCGAWRIASVYNASFRPSLHVSFFPYKV